MNKSPAIGEVMCFRFIQSENQPCPRASFAFEGNVEWKWNCLNRNICFIKKIHLVKIHLKSTGFSLLWKLANMATFIPIISLYEDSEQSTKTGKFFPTFFCRRELLETSVVSQTERRKDLTSHFTCIWFLKVGISAYDIQSPNQQIQFQFRVSDRPANSARPTEWFPVSFHFPQSSCKDIKSSHFWQIFPVQAPHANLHLKHKLSE